MEIIYREIFSQEELNKCAEIQRSSFGFSDLDIISPSLLKMYSRKVHPLGILVGCLKKDRHNEELIGFILAVSDLKNKSVYTALLGVLPEYQNKLYGIKLILKLREIALQRGIKKIYGIFDPLEANLGKLYLGVGIIIYQYLEDVHELSVSVNNFATNKVLFEWKISDKKIIRRIKENKKPNLGELLKKYPVITINNELQVKSKKILVEIPFSYKEMLNNDIERAKNVRIKFGLIFKELLNNKCYKIKDCLTGVIDKKRKTFYLFEKK